MTCYVIRFEILEQYLLKIGQDYFDPHYYLLYNVDLLLCYNNMLSNIWLTFYVCKLLDFLKPGLCWSILLDSVLSMTNAVKLQ